MILHTSNTSYGPVMCYHYKAKSNSVSYISKCAGVHSHPFHGNPKKAEVEGNYNVGTFY